MALVAKGGLEPLSSLRGSTGGCQWWRYLSLSLSLSFFAEAYIDFCQPVH